MGIVSLFRAVHIAAGCVALLLFWIPMVARKGGKIHRRVGNAYVAAMGVVGVTAFVVCGNQLVYGGPARRDNALFLFFIAVLSTSFAVNGVRALLKKSRTERSRSVLELGLPVLLVLSGLFIEVYGIIFGRPLFMAFAPVGIISGALQLRYWLRPPQGRFHWFFEHMGSMVGSSISTLTAFIVVNAPRLGLARFSILPWMVPGVVGTIGLIAWNRYYLRKPGLRSADGRVAAAHA